MSFPSATEPSPAIPDNDAVRIPLSLYIHMPWCVRKCPYCDFNSHASGPEGIPERDYIDALIRDIDFELPRIRNRSLQSIFFGGGTPSLFSAASLDRLLTKIRGSLTLSPDCEITMEANPGTFEAVRFRDYRQAGINRLSIGIQSFNDVMLKRLGRIHDGVAARDAIGIAQAAGFDSINLDLMYGLPGQTTVEALTDLGIAIDAGTPHLSWYQLTIEPNTVFYKAPPVVPDHDHLWQIQQAGLQILAAAGYDRYEVSAYALRDMQCRHNLNYWSFGDYVGIGAGAHGKLTEADGNITRYARHRLPDRYMLLAGNQGVITETRALAPDDLVLEFMLNALRMRGGFEHRLFTERTGLPLQLLTNPLGEASRRGWLETLGQVSRPTTTGLDYLNEMLLCFMPDQQEPAGAAKAGKRTGAGPSR